MTSYILETEIKLPVKRPAGVRRRLRALGFRVVTPRYFERNIVWDTRNRVLQRSGFLLRLRWEKTGRGTLTLKGPRQENRAFKIRREWEVDVSPPATAEILLTELGFQPVFLYEKYRAIFRRRSDSGKGTILLDETPIGAFLELEGSKTWIRRLTSELGFRPEDALTESYGEIFQRWKEAHRSRSRHMIFTKSRLTP